MKYLNEKVEDVRFDGLFTDIQPAALTRARTIRKLSAETVLARGTLMAIDEADQKLVVLGTVLGTEGGTEGDTEGDTEEDVLTPDCVLADDVTVGTEEDVNVVAYISGCFDPDRITVAEGYELTAADIDALRVRNILFKNAQND